MRRAAVLFDIVPPPPPLALPRMDVAAFVGFAASGPLDVPVPVEDVAHFRDLFSADPVLANDSQRQQRERAFLGPAVEAFFEGGGRRCWIIRVAQQPETLWFDLPGLIAVDGAMSDPLRARARSPGSWVNRFRVSSTLLAAPLRLLQPFEPSTDTIDVAVAPGALTRGDLLELRFIPANLRLFLVVDHAEPIDRGVRVSVARRQWAEAELFSPPQQVTTQSATLTLLSEPDALAQLSAWAYAMTDPAAVQLRRLSFELSVWHERRLEHRVSDLAFSALHPRFWGGLPSDEELFWRGREPRPDGRDEELAQFYAQVSAERASIANAGRRFPIAGPEAPQALDEWPLFLPSGMGLDRHANDAVAAQSATPGDLNAQDGLGAMSADLFYDARLRDYSGDSLLRSAEQLHNTAREWTLRGRGHTGTRLRGLHAALPLDQVSLIAIPDLVHRPWSSEASSLGDLLEAPWLLPPSDPDAAQRIELHWTSVENASGYELYVGESPEFEDATLLFAGTATRTLATLPATCALLRYFRVRAMRHGEPSPWSNTRVLEKLPGEFLPCEFESLPELRLEATLGSPDPASVVAFWSAEQGALTPQLTFRVQTARDPLFQVALEQHATSAATAALGSILDSALYVRVRAELGDALGPWSNTLVLPPSAASEPALAPLPEPSGTGPNVDHGLLLAVHRALLRFCHARGDLVGLLSLPRHYDAPLVLDYLAALAPDSSLPTRRTDRIGVPSRPLSLGEAPALSYGALYYPWLARRVDRGDEVLDSEFVPPDGTVAGLLAHGALGRGSWLSYANRVLPGVLALDPALDDAAAEELLGFQVNVLARDARGFVLLDDQTLDRERDARPLSVRRLLILIKKLALRAGADYVFEPNEPSFADRVRHHFERVLSTLHLRGALRGATAEQAFRVVTDASVNPQTSVDLGRFVVELRVAPALPMRFLRVRLLQGGHQALSVAEV